MGARVAWALLAASLLGAWLPGSAARAELGAEPVGRVATLPQRPGPHWFWLSDVLLHRTALFDADTGDMLGLLSGGTANVGFVVDPLFSPDHREIYLPESFYSRGVRGDRTDVVTVYDGQTLQPVQEIPIPPKRAEYYPGNAANALSDDGQFLAVFNLTPAQSLTLVDVRARRFVKEVDTPGCGLVFAAGPRRFFMVCGDGSLLVVSLGADGAPALARTKPFFDPNQDPLTEKAVRAKDAWEFVSYEGMIHSVDVSGTEIRFSEPWSLFDDADRKASWRIGGNQHLAVHAASGRLFALVHQGPADTHKKSGRAVWVYDIASHKRVQQISLGNPFAAFVREQMGFARGGAGEWMLGAVLPNPGADIILVTQDESPVLITTGFGPMPALVHDARTGKVIGEVHEAGLAPTLLFGP
ncbi:MAG TPA: amine dehydrogenase large subunit [Myxococcota bacterium]|nr:amine dehydrogenase large subunit [Myxococcota bacterium]